MKTNHEKNKEKHKAVLSLATNGLERGGNTTGQEEPDQELACKKKSGGREGKKTYE